MARTTRFSYRHLPHWEVEHGRYFVTARCADSLPREAVERLQELSLAAQALPPRSKAFGDFQRETFRTLEKFLDAGHGACPLKSPGIAAVVMAEFDALADWDVGIPHCTVMPNHWHAMIVPRRHEGPALSAIMKR